MKCDWRWVMGSNLLARRQRSNEECYDFLILKFKGKGDEFLAYFVRLPS